MYLKTQPSDKKTSKVALARQLGPKAIAAYLRRRTWADSHFLGLICDTDAIIAPPRASIPVVMEVAVGDRSRQFVAELPRVSGKDYHEVYARVRMCDMGVKELYVASAPDGGAIYAQWLVGPEDHAAMLRAISRPLRPLAADEMEVEGAYTFVEHRRKGAMADGMYQLLEHARAAGARRVITYVGEDNIGSLRGCAAVGFGLDHVRVTSERLGTRRILYQDIDERAQRAWDSATAPRSKT